MNHIEKSSIILNKLKKDLVLREAIISESEFLSTEFNSIPMRQRIYHYITKSSFQTCNNNLCSNRVKWSIKNKGYSRFCSSKCAHNSDEVKQKTEQTCLLKFGKKTNLQTTETKKKIKKTCQEKYGVDNFAQSFEFRDKYKKTCQEKYGVDNPAKLERFKKKCDSTHFERYGVKRQSQCHIPKNIIDLKNDYAFMNFLYNVERMPMTHISELLGINHSQLCIHFKKNLGIDVNQKMISYPEKEIRNFVDSFDIDTEVNNRTILSGKEIDIYMPKLKLGIEFDGLYWHSELYKDRLYHYEKDITAIKVGVKLIHITDYEWNHKQELVKNRLTNKLGFSDRIYARKCQIRIVNSTKEFLINNHIQGWCPSQINYGLYHNDVLVSLMTFGKSRYDTKIEYELIRYASLGNITVVGGAGKLLSHFIKNHHPNSMISYCDMRWNTGRLYKALGFDKIRWNKPNYWYTKNFNTFESRQRYQKHKLSKILPMFDESLTEFENMIKNGYNRYWDSGNTVWIWRK